MDNTRNKVSLEKRYEMLETLEVSEIIDKAPVRAKKRDERGEISKALRDKVRDLLYRNYLEVGQSFTISSPAASSEAQRKYFISAIMRHVLEMRRDSENDSFEGYRSSRLPGDHGVRITRKY